MLKALAVCKEKGNNYQLIIAGDGPEKENLHKLASDLGVYDLVVWLGAVAHDDIWALMNNADIFLITNDITNRCNPLYEAAWAGLPVVSVRDPSTADLLQHRKNALLSEKDDSETLGKNILDICGNDDLRQKLGAAQKELARSFWTWEERMRVEVVELEKLVKNHHLKLGKP
jgi:glycosyltransferase involved in cell wall biosynthesis